MTTEQDAAAEVSAAAENETSQEAVQPTVEDLQRRLEQAEQRAKSAEGRLKSRERTSAITGEAIADMESRITETFTNALTRAFETDDPVERAERIAQANAEHKARAALASEITEAQPVLDEIVERSGKSFDDPEFADAKRAWEQSRPKEAVLLARIAETEARTGNTFTKEEVEQMIDARLKNERVSSARVDSGGSTASTASPQKPTTQAELAAYLRTRRIQGNPVPASEQRDLIRGLQD